MSNLEVRTECLSGCQYGEAAQLTGGAWNSTTEVHTITATNAIDAVWLHLWNTSVAEVEVALVLNPDDTGTQADVDASTVRVIVPPKADLWALQGDRFRQHATQVGTAYTVAAYYVTGSSGDVVFSGHVDRMTQADLTL